jgi:hypothetical protein
LPDSEGEDKLLRRYMLRDLSDAEMADVEGRYLVDDVLFEALEIAEEQLIDSFLAGELSARENQQFERLFRSPARLARIEFARILLGQAGSPGPYRNISIRSEDVCVIEEMATARVFDQEEVIEEGALHARAQPGAILRRWQRTSLFVKLLLAIAVLLLLLGALLVAIRAT